MTATDPKPSFFREAVHRTLRAPAHIAPLAVLRIAFGAIMFFSTVRFVVKGWVTDFYVKPKVHFTFYGFDWVKPLGEAGMYIVFLVMGLTALGIMLGFFYRISAALFLLTFSYVELLDKTYYLNHYYLVTLLAFLLLLVPANRYFSLDVLRKPSLAVTHVPSWMINIFRFQLALVYFFAALAKLNTEWLLQAMPLRLWLPAEQHLPFIGPVLKQGWVAYVFSWFGFAYDLFIGFLLLNRRTRNVAFVFVVIFHLATALFFKIGMFPYIMIGASLIFFPDHVHRDLIDRLRLLFGAQLAPAVDPMKALTSKRSLPLQFVLITYFILQLALPFRYLFYPGDLFWTEEGYRFSWRVMLMEKNGLAFFSVEDPETGRKMEIPTSTYLTPFQEKMMATQPDMILQYAHFLDDTYRKKGMHDPVVTVQSYVTLNGSGSRLFIDSTVDLSRERESFRPKTWILPRTLTVAR
jgi:hypothetical protein